MLVNGAQAKTDSLGAPDNHKESLSGEFQTEEGVFWRLVQCVLPMLQLGQSAAAPRSRGSAGGWP
jgi:hypothetical protein